MTVHKVVDEVVEATVGEELHSAPVDQTAASVMPPQGAVDEDVDSLWEVAVGVEAAKDEEDGLLFGEPVGAGRAGV